tara:strand:- start:2281 stop:2934 length:654 start_codon:yes stop_codon:yes gene_type:complete
MTTANPKRIGLFQVQIIGEPQVIQKKDGTSFTKYKVSGMDMDKGVEETFEVGSEQIHRLELGEVYDIECNPPSGNYPPTVRRGDGAITHVNMSSENIPAPALAPAPVTAPAPAPAPIAAPQVAASSAVAPPKLSISERHREWNVIAREAPRIADERVRTKVDLLLAGKLHSDDGSPIDAITTGTLEMWYGKELETYWIQVVEMIRNHTGAEFGGFND